LKFDLRVECEACGVNLHVTSVNLLRTALLCSVFRGFHHHCFHH
jgi:hypothetical protein